MDPWPSYRALCRIIRGLLFFGTAGFLWHHKFRLWFAQPQRNHMLQGFFEGMYPVTVILPCIKRGVSVTPQLTKIA